MSVVATKQEVVDKYLRLYKNNIDEINTYGADFLNNKRQEAFDEFKEKGFPHKKNERYKYTFLQPFFEYDYKSNFSPNTYQVNLDEIFKCDIPELDTYTVLTLNGNYYTRNNPAESLPKNVVVTSMQEASQKYPELLKKHFDKYAQKHEEGLVAFNTMFSQDGIFVHVPKNVVLDKPLQIINVALSERDLLINHRNLIVMDENSQANIVVCDHTLCFRRYLTNSVTEFYLGDNANLEYNKIQNENNESIQIGHTYVHQEQNSYSRFNTITLHGGLVRNNLNIRLLGENAESQAQGLFLTDRKQHVDNYTNIEHVKPHCQSTQLYKGILDDQATGAFNGKIHVYPDAQKTVAYQTNNNIQLTDDAKMHSKPTLEIYADDVKCSHGATSGQLDEKAMFYLRSRGIKYEEARFLLLYAFADEIISKISVEPLQMRIHELVDRRLRGELSRCHNCQITCD
ncbi:MAG: Fe-S cluster assembly protein SufD [Bacteroidetes bacterium]|jgi:Fe-S cluster assembly protein SufD|nr:Fe-S cluster assembly protein SufD [Bacteroidota bacterium]